MRKLILGIGINDANYVVKRNETTVGTVGKRKNKLEWFCPYYRKWIDMIRRCYCSKYLERHPTYVGCSVSDEWLRFSNFKQWVDSQPNRDWQNCHLDKDLLQENNKVYSKDFCVFITPDINKFLLDRKLRRGKYMLGVGWNTKVNRFTASCSNPFKQRKGYIGYFDTELEAHLAWRYKKHEYACVFADMVEDERVSLALRTRYI